MELSLKRMISKFLYSSFVLCICVVNISSDVTITVSVTQGTSRSSCDSIGSSEPVWGAKVEGSNFKLFRGTGYDCPRATPPAVIFTSTKTCADQLTSVNVCLGAGDDSRVSLSCDGLKNFDQLSCKKSGCRLVPFEPCLTPICDLVLDTRFDVAGNNGVYTQNVNFRVTRTGDCPTPSPTKFPTPSPTKNPTKFPTPFPTPLPSTSPTKSPTTSPNTPSPTQQPVPTFSPTRSPTKSPLTSEPTPFPTNFPTVFPTKSPNNTPTQSPTKNPTTSAPTNNPTFFPTRRPTRDGETFSPTTERPSASPSHSPTTNSPSSSPITSSPTFSCATEFQQCGGVDWVGATCCKNKLTCTSTPSGQAFCKEASTSTNAPASGSSVPGPSLTDESLMVYGASGGGVLLLLLCLLLARRSRTVKRKESVALMESKNNLQELKPGEISGKFNFDDEEVVKPEAQPKPQLLNVAAFNDDEEKSVVSRASVMTGKMRPEAFETFVKQTGFNRID